VEEWAKTRMNILVLPRCRKPPASAGG